MLTSLNLLDGEPAEPLGGDVVTRASPHDPAREIVLPGSGPEQVRRALDAARERQPGWAESGPAARGDALLAAVAALREQAPAIAETMVDEVGTTPAEAAGEIANAARVLDFYAASVWRDAGLRYESVRPRTSISLTREPLGVVAALTPWNFPVNLAMLKIGPALAVGNTVVLKPSPQGACTTTVWARAVAAVLPAGVLNVVQGDGELGADLVARPDTDAVSFTGSTRVGRAIATAAAARGVPAVCEMGGKNTVAVGPDADLGAAADAVLAGAFGMAGQKCTATSRVAVHTDRYAEFRDLLTERAAAWTAGPPRDASTRLGPLIDTASRDRVLGLVEDAERRGARVFTTTGSLVPEGLPGAYLNPVVLEDVPAAADIASTEVFGPVVALHRVADLDAAVALANSGDYGLVASVFTRRLNDAMEFIRRVRCGTVLTNQPTAGLEFQVPTGGWKASGQGGAEQSDRALRLYSREKVGYLSW